MIASEQLETSFPRDAEEMAVTTPDQETRSTEEIIADETIRQRGQLGGKDLTKFREKEQEWQNRDHALFVAFAPYKNPRYAISVIMEHSGSGSSGAAPIAKKVIKKVLERHKHRKIYQLDLFKDA